MYVNCIKRKPCWFIFVYMKGNVYCTYNMLFQQFMVAPSFLVHNTLFMYVQDFAL